MMDERLDQLDPASLTYAAPKQQRPNVRGWGL